MRALSRQHVSNGRRQLKRSRCNAGHLMGYMRPECVRYAAAPEMILLQVRRSRGVRGGVGEGEGKRERESESEGC